MLNFTAEDLAGHKVGDVIKLQGKNYKLDRSTGRNIAVRRWFWFDVLIERVIARLGCPK